MTRPNGENSIPLDLPNAEVKQHLQTIIFDKSPMLKALGKRAKKKKEKQRFFLLIILKQR